MMDSKYLKINLLLAFFLMGIMLVSCQILVDPEVLKKSSDETNAYFMDEMNQAFEGVRSMKKLKEKAETKYQAIMERLKETKSNKEEALKVVEEIKQQLNKTQNVCNETMLALWEGCKPCLKQTCIRFYSKTCSSGAGLVGRQFQEYLDHTTPFSLWLNADKIDDLEDKDEEQEEKLEEMLEEKLEEKLEELEEDFENHHRSHRSFQDLFKEHQRMMERSRRLMEHVTAMQDKQNSSSENATSNVRVVCKQLRRNSEGCLMMKDKCDKCKEILAVDCSGKESMQSSREQQYIDAMRLAEKYRSDHKKLLEKFQEEMLNMTGVLDQLNELYGWVVKLANYTGNGEAIFKVSATRLQSGHENGPPNTTVTAKLFDSEPFTFTVPGKISLKDPGQYALVAHEALKQFKKKEQAGSQNESVAASRNESVAASRNESVAASRNESVAASRNESVAASRNESVAASRNESVAASRNESVASSRNEFIGRPELQSYRILKTHTL